MKFPSYSWKLISLSLIYILHTYKVSSKTEFSSIFRHKLTAYEDLAIILKKDLRFFFFFWFISQSNYTKKKKKEETKEYTNTSPRSRARAQHDTWAGSVFWLCARNKGKDRAVPFGRKNSCASLNSSSRCTSWRTSSRGAPLCTASKYRAAVGRRRADLWLKQGSIMLHQSMIILSSCEGEKEEEKQKKRRKIEKNIYI